MECRACDGIGIRSRNGEPMFCLVCDVEGELGEGDLADKSAAVAYFDDLVIAVPETVRENTLVQAWDKVLQRIYGPIPYDLYKRGAVIPDGAAETAV